MSDVVTDHNVERKWHTEFSAAASKLSKAARGALNRFSETGNEFFQELVSAGEALQARSSEQAARAGVTWRLRLADLLGLPTREDVESLDKKLNRISRKVNKLAREQK
jgi:polyhydroxyalkanoate synthesis regulator phasin